MKKKLQNCPRSISIASRVGYDEAMEHPDTLDATNRDLDAERRLKERLAIRDDGKPVGLDKTSESDPR